MLLEGVDCRGIPIRGVAIDGDAEQATVVSACRAACSQDHRCGAWSLNQTSDGQQDLRRCWLHHDCADKRVDDRAISGLVSHGSASQAVASTTKTTTRSTLVPVINVHTLEEMPPHGLDGVLVDTNCWGQDLAEVAVEGANHAARNGKGHLVVAACRLACIDNPGCTAWTLNYGSAGMQGRGHCWLKAACTGQVKDTRAISGTITDDASSKDAQVIDGGDALKRMEEKSQQTKKIVGGVVGAGVGALAVGLIGGLLGKRATDSRMQGAHDQTIGGGVGGTRGMGGNQDTGYGDAGSATGNGHGHFAQDNTVSDAFSAAANASSAAAASASSAAVGAANASASGLHGLANGSAAGTALLDSDSSGGAAALAATDASTQHAGIEEHAVMWWWIPLLLLLAGLLLCLGLWCLRKSKSSREFKGRHGSKRGGAVSDINVEASSVDIDVPPSPASSACSEAPMLDHVASSKSSRMYQQTTRSAQVGMQESASMQVGGDLFDALDTNHDGVIDKEEFDRVFGGCAQGARTFQGSSATMVAGGGAMMTGGGTRLMKQQSQQQTGWFQSRTVYEGASASMSVGGSACMSPGASVSMMPPGASVSLMPTVATTVFTPVTLSPAASVSVVPPTTTMSPQRMFTATTTTVNSPCKSRSMTPPPSFGSQRASFGRQTTGGMMMSERRAPAWL